MNETLEQSIQRPAPSIGQVFVSSPTHTTLEIRGSCPGKEPMNNEKSDGGTTVPCISLFGLLVCRRTSVWDGKPCDEAEEVPFIRVDRRTIDDPMKNPHIGKAWYETGRNHRVENGMIARDFDDKRWVVRIADGAALQAFCEKYGEIILSLNTNGTEPCYEVEFYDDYRE